MDPTLAALAGAALGAIATATVPFLTIRARRRDEAADRRRDDTLAFLDATIRMIKARGVQDWQLYSNTHSEAVVALERLLLNAPERDLAHLQSVTNYAFESVTQHENLALATVGVEAMSQVLRRWCRGELKGRAIGDAYEPALDVQFAKHESRRS